MRDLEFLTDRPAFAGALIYRYRSGILRPQIRAALADIAGQEGRDLAGCERDELATVLGGGSFFTPVYWCDWTALTPSSVLAAKLDTILARIIAMAGDRFALFVPFENPLSTRSLWPEVERSVGLVIVEEHVTRETLMPALRLFQATSDLSKGAEWLADRAFVASFDQFRGRRKRTLLELRHAFDVHVASCIDPVTQTFRPKVYRNLYPDQTRERGPSMLRDLRRLLARRRGWDRFDLVRTFDERHNRDGWTAHAVVKELHRITGTILEEASYPKPLAGVGSVRDIDLVLWAALLLAGGERLHAIVVADADGYRRRPNSLITALDELGRDFLARADLGIDADPLAGAWAGLDDALRCLNTNPADALASARGATVDALNCHLGRTTTEFPWLLRLGQRVRRAIDEAMAAEAKRRNADRKDECAAQDAEAQDAEAQDAEAQEARAHAEHAKIARASAERKGDR